MDDKVFASVYKYHETTHTQGYELKQQQWKLLVDRQCTVK